MSTNSPLWLTANASPEEVDVLVEALAVPRRVASWLVARNISSPHEARRFLYAHEQFTDPYDFHEMRKAVERLKIAIEQQETIVIVGDYDVDGVTASTVVASELEAHGAKWACLIPERINDGYGLSPTLVERAQALGASLILTVDNGIRADEALERACALSIDVIVTDHHEPGEADLPPCEAVVHWSRHERPGDAIVLSGAGVAWKLTQALRTARPQVSVPSDHDDWLLGLAALGAISDIMPMRGENRRLIREGLAALRQCRRAGWIALCERARVEVNELTVTGVSWRIAPRMNAAGRMANAAVAFGLLMAERRQDAASYADRIEELNVERKRVTDEAVREAQEQVEDIYGDGPYTGVVAAGPWPLGVVGIVAAKLADRYGCPAIVLADMGTDVLRGSGRSRQGVSLHAALMDCAAYLDHFGGHDAAVGCGVLRSQVEPFRTAFARTIGQMSSTSDEADATVADDFLPIEEATLDTLDWLLRFSPYGPENEPLRFFVGPVQIARVTPLKDGAHLRIKVQEGSNQMELVWFNAPEGAQSSLQVGQMFGFVAELEENVWQGTRKPQLRVVEGWLLEDPVVRDVFALFYRHLLKNGKVPEEHFQMLANRHGIANIETILETFVELGFAARRDGAYHVLEAARSRDLREALSYQAHLRSQLVHLQ